MNYRINLGLETIIMNLKKGGYEALLAND